MIYPISLSLCFCRPTERELTERQIKTSLREIMMQKDLENVTCKEVSHGYRCRSHLKMLQTDALTMET